MRVDRAGVDHAFVAPDVVEQFIAVLHAASALHQRPQQLELETSEMHPFAVDANLMARRIDRNRAGLERFLWFFAAPQNCPNSQHNFARAERLGYIIVSAEFQTDNAIDLFRLCGQHQDRNVSRRSVAFQNSADFESGHFWQHQIENDTSGPVIACLLQTGCSIGGCRRLEARLAQAHL